MRVLIETATGLPVLLFTAALVVAGCFWLLVALGLTTARAFDADADVRAWGMGGAPVAVVLSLLTLIAWLLAMGAAVLLAAFGPAGSATGLLRLPVAAGALFAAWRLTRFFVRPLHRPCPDEPEPSRSVRALDGDRGGLPHAPRDGADAPVTRVPHDRAA
ncbi:hypothetical protein G3I20_24325 [Streptomyces sp. SID8111]|uniref:hypothetical protein n=1 Tax=Streptomyces sp. SID8111 TaxID=2706100 RepID=UPI0013BEF808|nr:hypothetical protein [Streptomyces sp. SID8111]NEC29626.1 hypothetical protein [Streptomyces sp. SID8111]